MGFCISGMGYHTEYQPTDRGKEERNEQHDDGKWNYPMASFTERPEPGGGKNDAAYVANAMWCIRLRVGGVRYQQCEKELNCDGGDPSERNADYRREDVAFHHLSNCDAP
jgi:hypothetical protein